MKERGGEAGEEREWQSYKRKKVWTEVSKMLGMGGADAKNTVLEEKQWHGHSRYEQRNVSLPAPQRNLDGSGVMCSQAHHVMPVT